MAYFQGQEEHTPGYRVFLRLKKLGVEVVYCDGGIDIKEYTHALRDNDIRHIRNSHGEKTNEKYPVTANDIKRIPWV